MAPENFLAPICHSDHLYIEITAIGKKFIRENYIQNWILSLQASKHVAINIADNMILSAISC